VELALRGAANSGHHAIVLGFIDSCRGAAAARYTRVKTPSIEPDLRRPEGGGSERRRDARLWLVARFPPAGPLTLAFAWP
jgi:hypothetical protein